LTGGLVFANIQLAQANWCLTLSITHSFMHQYLRVPEPFIYKSWADL